MCGGGCRTVFKEAYSRIRKQALKERKRAFFFFRCAKTDQLSGYKRRQEGREPGGTSAPLDCGPK